ncbi:MAG: hypothetical protein U9N10_04055 [Bacillota bacterium]|nr:hypothetical protein [Bacillota bacterium]
MGFMDKVKKGLGSAVDGAKIAGNMAIIKKNVEQAKLKKNKQIKEIGEILYENKEAFTENELFSEKLFELSETESDLEKFEIELKEESAKFKEEEEKKDEE